MSALLGLYFEVTILSPLRRRIWGTALGISIFFGCFPNALFAGQEPLIRVLVKDSTKFRFRADRSIPLLVKGISNREKKVSSLDVQIKHGQLLWTIDSLSGGWRTLPLDKNIVIRTSDARGIWLGKRRYRGQLRVGVKNKQLIAVNHLGIERYLMSVVGSEMPKEWPQAALRAQAIAARTYALRKILNKGSFDIDSSESSQVYLGIESETPSTRNAVNSTRSLVIRHKGKLISAVFHSSSGGRTESSGSVWKYQLPYLKSVRDYDQQSPKYRWERNFNQSELKKIFFEIGGLKNIRILKVSNTGRIIQSKVYGPKGYLFLSGKDLRKRMNLNSTKAAFKLLTRPVETQEIIKRNSIHNKFKDLPPLPGNDNAFFLSVKGFGSGHGVGMSQWGANGMSKQGANYRRILKHYYSGVTINPY